MAGVLLQDRILAVEHEARRRSAAVREVDYRDLVETVREGLLVLDPDLTVRFANRSFGDTFAVTPEDTVGLKLYELGNGQWDIPVTNAVKYAFPSETRGSIAATLKRFPGELRLIVSDDGKGIDPRRKDSGRGGRLVETLRDSSAVRSNGRAATREPS